ncbi:hypothetical protein BST17_20740 [Mycolicibacterium bacteremicum]|uniref:Uncharacterized protein n=1 Tax=Mycolicibacterium bacteremicum TaxID=564198 RepID=A0A1W9YSM9_MYCBA|nr:hypothetical protein BST17_20740 [Mycolicibacterium bacteremicum]
MRPVPNPNEIGHVRNSPSTEHPLNMLLVVGKLIELLLPHEFSYRARNTSNERIDPTQLIDEAAVVRAPHYAEVVALLGEMAVGDECFQQWCRDEVAARSVVVPRWITNLPDLMVGRAMRLTDVFGDLDEILFEVRLAGGHAITCGVLIDHLEYSTVKDVGIWDKPLNAVLVLLESWECVGIPVEMTTADARAWIEQAFGNCIAREVRERRPGFSAVVKWLAARLPDGGRQYPSSDADPSPSDVVEAFFASPEGERFSLDEFGEMLEQLIGMRSGDPLRWSAFRVIYAAGDLPDGWYEPVETVLRLPALLRAFVRYAHERSGISAELTDQTLAMIDEVQKGFEDRVRGGLQEYWDAAG